MLLLDGLDADRPFRPEIVAELRALRTTKRAPVKRVAAVRGGGYEKTSVFVDAGRSLMSLAPVASDDTRLDEIVDAFAQIEGKVPTKEKRRSLLARRSDPSTGGRNRSVGSLMRRSPA